METSDRHKQDIRATLESETLKKEFDLDKRKFSRNYEGSVFLEALNTGAKAEGDLIWSQKSFIPRSAAVNLTVDLFGHSVNLFEMGGRVEGLEYFLEKFFGPSGYFNQKDTDETVATGEDIPDVKMDKLDKINKRVRLVPKLLLYSRQNIIKLTLYLFYWKIFLHQCMFFKIYEYCAIQFRLRLKL